MCLAAVIVDGFDAQIMGYVAPELMRAWGISRTTLAPVISAGLFGLMIGALVLGSASDRIGRRRVLVLSTTLLGVFSLMTTMATSTSQMAVFRFLTGLGLGGVIPAAIALVSEHSPARINATMVTVTACGFAIGPALGGLIAAPLMHQFGWSSMFILGGVIPLMLAPCLWRWLPESAALVSSESASLASAIPSVRQVFTEGRAAHTLLLWVALFLNLIALNLQTAWLPTVIMGLGFPLAQAATSTSMFHFGGVLGGLLLGRFVDRFGYVRVIVAILLLAALTIVSIGAAGSSLVWLRVSIFAAGIFVVGGQALLNGFSGMLYPRAIRSTGSGWALGVGRLGAVVGPVLGAFLISLHFDVQALFYLEASPLIAAALAIACIGIARPHAATIQQETSV